VSSTAPASYTDVEVTDLVADHYSYIEPEEEVRTHLDLPSLVNVVGDALGKQAAGEVERPDRPHFPVGIGLEGNGPTGTAITMPAYIHGEEQYATKLVGVHEGNADRGYPTIHVQIALTDA